MRTRSLAVLAFALAAACKDGVTPPPTPPGVISLALGETRTLTASQAATIQVSGGSAGGDFVLIPFHGSQTASSTVTLELNGTQIVTPTSAAQIAPPGDIQLSLASSTEALAGRARFDATLRRMERGELGSKLATIRAARDEVLAPRYSISGSAPVPAVGDQMTLNVARTSCSGADLRTGTVVVITQRTVIVADNANPSGGFTTDDYQQIGQRFDELVYPTITQNFGEPTDIDANGARSLVFYTRAVNELSPANSESVVGGFFHPRDLFPKVGPDPNSTADDCATSNEAEMFYMLVPDPDGEVNGNKRSLDYVRRTTVGVLAHEFQHLINGSRRIYVNNASSFEEVWLNEGLSHIAEELMFYRASGLAPRQNITLTILRSSQTILDAANAYQVANLGRLIEFVENPEGQSPYAANDELGTRGATWQLLRYAADRNSTAEQTLWFNLANSRNAGITNFTAVFGGTFIDLVRDWATAQYTDDRLLTTAILQHPSWNYRSLLPTLINSQNPPPYPLRTRTLAASTPLTLTLRGGGAAYVRFGVAGSGTAAIAATSSGAAVPSSVSFTVVRTR